MPERAAGRLKNPLPADFPGFPIHGHDMELILLGAAGGRGHHKLAYHDRAGHRTARQIDLPSNALVLTPAASDRDIADHAAAVVATEAEPVTGRRRGRAKQQAYRRSGAAAAKEIRNKRRGAHG